MTTELGYRAQILLEEAGAQRLLTHAIDRGIARQDVALAARVYR